MSVKSKASYTCLVECSVEQDARALHWPYEHHSSDSRITRTAALPMQRAPSRTPQQVIAVVDGAELHLCLKRCVLSSRNEPRPVALRGRKRNLAPIPAFNPQWAISLG